MARGIDHTFVRPGNDKRRMPGIGEYRDAAPLKRSQLGLKMRLVVTSPIAQVEDHSQVLWTFTGKPYQLFGEQVILSAAPLTIRSQAQVRIDKQGAGRFGAIEIIHTPTLAVGFHV